MEPTSASNTAKFVGTVAQFGSQISRIIHDFITLEDPRCEALGQFLGHLGATVHALIQIRKLLEDDAALKDDEKLRALFRQDGVDYVAVLAEECSVALCRAKATIEGSIVRGRDHWNPSNWASSLTVDDKGQKIFVAPALDETQFFQQLTDTKWYRLKIQIDIDDVGERLEQLHLLLLLVVQVLTVRGMTTKAPSACGDLKSIVQYHSRIERAAELADIIGPGSYRLRRSRSSSLSYYSSSDSDSDFSERPVRRRKNFKPVVIKPRPPPPPPPQATFPPRPFGGPVNPPSTPFNPIRGVQIVDVQCGPPKDAHPPSYTESVTLNADGSVTVTEKAGPEKPVLTPGSSNLSGTTMVPDNVTKKEEEMKPAKIPVEETASNQARLLNAPSGLGMKIKSIFRSKSSLEAEMKRTLADDNASLAAYVIQGGDFFKVPHSAFHSLEYTHMRTILSQLQDNSWFKTFSDLRDREHDALTDLGLKRMENGKWLKRELVVLKVLQENKLNAWVRVVESCMGLDEFLPQHENDRIILAIVRDTECKSPVVDDGMIVPETKGVVNASEVQPRGLPRMGEPKINIINGPPSPPHVGPRPRLGGPPPTQWTGPGGPPPPPGAGSFPPYMSCQRSDVTPQVPLNETTAREALTTYKAYTFRPIPPHPSPTDAAPPSRPTWTRCFVTYEHEMKSVLQERVAAFNRRGDSIIDLKLQLTEPQSAQLSRLIDESNRLEADRNFEHKIVELSMIDRERGLVKRQTMNLNVDVMHVVLQRSPKETVDVMHIYNLKHGPPPFRPMPRPGPPPILREPEIITIGKPKCKKGTEYRRGRFSSDYSTSSDSDSDSNSDSDSSNMTDSSVGSRRKGGKSKKKANRSDSDSEQKPRWKKDPVIVKLDKLDKKRDIVELLLDRWTLAGEGKEKTEVKASDTKKVDKKKKKKGKRSMKINRRGKKYYSDSDSDSTSLTED